MLSLEDFGRPVESIMMCDDFKSSFARKLSHRYTSRAAVKQDLALKISKDYEPPPKAAETFESPKLSKNSEQIGDVVKAPDKADADLKSMEVSALNMEVETLRWQLSQTEANRQMHIALLRQVVSFLSRVKEHIEHQKPEMGSKENMSRLTPRSLNADLPRSKSVVHMNKNREFSASPSKKMAARKISKSISNVSGYKDNSGWIPSKLFSTPEEDNSLKITEEISRFITLANTVLGTKLPDLASNFSEPEYASIYEAPDNKNQNMTNISNTSLNLSDEDVTNAFIMNTICDSDDAFKGFTNDFECKDTSNNFSLSSSQVTMNELEIERVELKTADTVSMISANSSPKAQRFLQKKNEYNHAANFVEDESGFSSMSSFQEIGIPIISVIPPSPCKEVGYMDEISDILEDAKWKSTPVDLNKESVKVFWV